MDDKDSYYANREDDDIIDPPMPDEPTLEAGEIYEAVIESKELKLKVETQWGVKDQEVLTFVVAGPQGDQVIKENWTRSTNEASNLGAAIVALFGPDAIKTRFNMSKLVGQRCRVLVKHSAPTESGRVFPHVDKVLKPTKADRTLEDDAQDPTL